MHGVHREKGSLHPSPLIQLKSCIYVELSNWQFNRHIQLSASGGYKCFGDPTEGLIEFVKGVYLVILQRKD